MKRDEAVLKKSMEENERLKRDAKKSAPAVSQPIIREAKPIDDDDMKQKFIENITSKM